MTISVSMTGFGTSATIYTTNSATNMMRRTIKVSILGSTPKFTEISEPSTAIKIMLDHINISVSTSGAMNNITNTDTSASANLGRPQCLTCPA